VDRSLSLHAAQLAAEAFNGHPSYAVLTMDDIARVAEVDATGQALGVQQSAEWLQKVGNLANAKLLVTGSVGQVGRQTLLTLELVDSATAVVKNRVTQSLTSAGELQTAVPKAVASLMGWHAQTATAFKLPTGQSVSFAVLDLAPNGVTKDVASSLTQVLSVELKRIHGASVISHDDIKAMLQLQEQKSKLGCDDASCLAEIGGALGADKLVVGSIAKIADSYLVALRLLSVRTVKVESRISESFMGGEDQLIRAVRHAGRRLVGVDVTDGGTLALSASEPGASVTVDSRLVGSLPMKPVSGLKPGQHLVRVQKRGHFDWNGSVYVDPGDTTALWIELNPIPLKWYQKWWVWTIMSSVAGGFVLGTFVAATLAAGVGFAGYRFLNEKPPESGSGSVTVR
jgi:hypothetical protein